MFTLTVNRYSRPDLRRYVVCLTEMGYHCAVQIRQSQIADMTSLRKEASYRSMVHQLRTSTPNAVKGFSDDSLLNVIRAAAAKAESYGITKAEPLTMFVKLAVFAGPSFDQHPAVAGFLRIPELDPDYKVTLLAQLVAEKLSAGNLDEDSQRWR